MHSNIWVQDIDRTDAPRPALGMSLAIGRSFHRLVENNPSGHLFFPEFLDSRKAQCTVLCTFGTRLLRMCTEPQFS